ncbi:MAG: YdeI/OmpD-associated family protein [Balneolaceae bacterium]|nr:YdeI/OmpD-associated family protein [Balneolaceae bacterium]MBO6546336.1 YdeI/OmpD-associated family protein [Balneolaceae bacterium]MBO6648695.1 YdeI/OmpD-associated family protein [Balneolaceae bacterium]
MIPEVDTFIEKARLWKDELIESRRIVLECGLTEEVKWYQPCYTFNGNNVVILSCFKKYYALSFFKGALLDDPTGILVQPTENMQAGRQIRFTDVSQILEQEAQIKAIINSAIEVEKKGLKVDFKDTSEYKVPQELLNKFEEDPNYKKAFYALTPGRQRGYLLHFSGAKQSSTRAARIERCEDKIYAGKGFNER